MIKVAGESIQNIAEARVKKLNRYVNASGEYLKRRDIVRAIACLHIVNTEKLYLEGGYTSIYDLTTKVLGLSKPTTTQYMSVARKFIDIDTARSVFWNEGKDFNYNQLLELKKLTVEEVQTLLADGKITFELTAKEVKEVVSSYIQQKKEDKKQAKEDAIKPIKEAYEAFHSAYNALSASIGDNKEQQELLQKIMDSVVILYNDNDRLWN